MLRVITSFLASFFAVFVMIFLYIFLPIYLLETFAPQTAEKIHDITPVKEIRETFNIAPVQPSPTLLPTPKPTPALIPATLIIPKLNIQAAVESVGLTPTNNMDVPKNAADVAWYMHGPSPGQEGNAVITGHYDTPTGRPAVFYNLKKLKPGDEVTVISSQALKSTFIVNEISSIPYDIFPSDFVFKTKPGHNLNIITCNGVWDRQKRIYTERIVVYTTLKETTDNI